MPTVQGFVQSLEARSDGSVAVDVLSPHSGNQRRTVTIQNVDGDLTKVNKKLAQVGLLRDALSATLPVVVQYHTDDKQGDLVDEVTALPTRSIEGRLGGNWIGGWVIGLLARERGPESTASPYRDEADDASVVLLLDGGNVETYRIDLQRRYEATGHAVLSMCAEARRTRRRIELFVHAPERRDDAAGHAAQGDVEFALGARWETLRTESLQEVLAFVERIGQRTESYDQTELRTVDHLWVSYRTAPPMQPEADVSANGSFVPVSGLAWVHRDSPLAETLREALQDGLQVSLGLLGDEIHMVELLCPLASAARPVWITFETAPLCEEPSTSCVTVPTIQNPTEATLNNVPHNVRWHGTGWFARGIWRIVVSSAGKTSILIDCKAPCVRKSEELQMSTDIGVRDAPVSNLPINMRPERPTVLIAHAYLDGVHELTFDVSGHTCSSLFRVVIYRIR